MSLLENELARRDGNGLALRPQPVRVRWVFDDLATADDHDLRCVVTASVRAVDDPVERRTLQEVLLGGRWSVSADDVSTHFAPTLRAAAASAARAKGVEAWLAPDARGDLVDAIKAAAAKVAFACGLEVLPPYEVELESRSYEQHRLAAMQRALAEKQAAGQVEHFARAAELLKKFHELRAAAPDLSVGQVLDQISPADRGSMLQTLLLASAKQERDLALWAVAGEYLVRIDPPRDAGANGGTPAAPRAALTPLPPTIGPTRSVQPADVDGERVLLVGARGGFMAVRPGSGEEPAVYADPGVESQLGFSRVVYQGPGRGFVGCHGEAGLVRWMPGRTSSPVSTFRPDRFAGGAGSPARAAPVDTSVSIVGSRAPGPRNLQVVDHDRLIFSVGSRVWLMHGEDFAQLQAESDAEVIAIVPAERRMIVVHEDGTICTFDRETGQLACVQRRGERLRAAGGLPWLGGTRLLLAADDGPAECVGLDDVLVTHYASPYRGLRVLAGSADLVAAVTSDRQRLVLWHTWDGRRPAGEVYLTAQTRHRVADIEFG